MILPDPFHRGRNSGDRLKRFLNFIPDCSGNVTAVKRRKAATGCQSRKGMWDAYVSTEDAASLYPSIMETLNLCSSSYINAPLIKMYDIPRWEYAKFTLGSAQLNMAGEALKITPRR